MKYLDAAIVAAVLLKKLLQKRLIEVLLSTFASPSEINDVVQSCRAKNITARSSSCYRLNSEPATSPCGIGQ